MHAVPVTVIHLPGCTSAPCLKECSMFATRTGKVLQRSYCEKDDCCCVFNHQLASAEIETDDGWDPYIYIKADNTILLLHVTYMAMSYFHPTLIK
jgi:hypothetical protein